MNTVVSRTALTEVVILEVVRLLGEAVAATGSDNYKIPSKSCSHVGNVVEGVHDVEGVRGGSLHVLALRRRHAGVVPVVEDLPIGALLSGTRALRALVRDHIVAAGVGGRAVAVAVPAVGRRSFISLEVLSNHSLFILSSVSVVAPRVMFPGLLFIKE